MFALHQSVDLETSGPPKMLIVAINKKYTITTSRSFYKKGDSTCMTKMDAFVL